MGISIGIGGSPRKGGGGTAKINQQVVNTLPETGSSDTIYFVRNQDSEGDNLYTEYLWVNNKWERFGDIDPTEYYTKDEVEAMIDETQSNWEDA